VAVLGAVVVRDRAPAGGGWRADGDLSAGPVG
jgi:hypothetical protein